MLGGARGNAGGLPERVRKDLHAKRVQDDARPVTRSSYRMAWAIARLAA